MGVAFAVWQAREESSEDLMHKEWFTVEEIAELFRLSPLLIREAVWHGELRATAFDHHIFGVRRDDLIAWLCARAAE